MKTYTQRVRDSILPLSVSDNLPAAFDEWQFSGHTEDHGEPSETCELCGHEGLRYHFEIHNHFTDGSLLVGSQCILQFSIAVYENGAKVSTAEAKKILDKHTERMRLESCLRALERLAKSEKSDILEGALQYYRVNKRLTPKQAFVVFWRLRTQGIDHSPSFFKINLRKQRWLRDLASMETSRVHFFGEALSSSQRQRAMELGHSPPPALSA